MTQTETLENYLLTVQRGRNGLLPSMLRTAASLLAPVYCAGLETYLFPYKIGLRRRTVLPAPVISIGNLTVGGTGKTPLTISLCRMLQSKGIHPAVLNRGYGGGHERDSVIVSDEQSVQLGAQEAGDEAYLLAKNLPGAPVIAGKDRRITGALAIGRFQPDLLILDDGLQFWQLHRDLDIVLLNACDPFDNGWTFPRGLLREPPSHLRRANIILLTHALRIDKKHRDELIQQLRKLAPGRPILSADMAPDGLRSLIDGKLLPNHWLQGKRIVALSAIGQPAIFETMLGEMGANVADQFRLRDHASLTIEGWDQVDDHAKKTGAEAIVMTEKDAVKLPAGWKSDMPKLILQVRMQVEGEQELLHLVQEAMEKSGRRRI